MVQTDKRVRSDGLAFNCRHNTASASTDKPAQTCFDNRPAAGQLLQSESAIILWGIISHLHLAEVTVTDAVQSLAGCCRKHLMDANKTQVVCEGKAGRVLILTF